MAATIENLIDDLERSYTEVQERMSDPSVYNDRREAAEVGRRLKDLEVPYKLAQEWRTMREDVEASRADPELKELVAESEQRLAELEEELKLALVETDPADQKDVILEIRQGVGGDEAAIWAGDVLRMLTRYAESRGFKTELLSASESDGGGYKEVVLGVKGDGAYSVFKYEGGTHRVQRVPETESQGRIHTSTATVAVMPEAEEVEVEINDNDLKIDVYRSTGPAARASTRPTRPSGSRICRQGSSSRCRTRSRSSRTRPRRCACFAPGSTGGARAPAGRALGDAQVADRLGRAGREDPHLQLPGQPREDHRVKVTLNLEKVLPGGLDDFTEALQAEDRRRALEE